MDFKQTKNILPDRLTAIKENFGKLENLYREYLFNDYLPFIDQYVFDHEHGGFCCSCGYRGDRLSSNKRTWYDARGAWIYAILYRDHGVDSQYLDKARLTLMLLEKTKDEKQVYWPWSYNQYGLDLNERQGDIYGNLFVAEAYIAYGSAVKEIDFQKKGKAILMDVYTLIQQPSYRYILDYAPGGRQASVQDVLGHWMILLNVSSSYLEDHGDDEQIIAIVDHCINALMENHFQRECGLLLEVKSDHKAKGDIDWDDFAYLGHAIEALWMVIKEAHRRNDIALFELATKRFRRHVEVAWDDLYGGFFHSLESIDNYHFLTDKVLWAQHEVLIGCTLLIEIQNDPWAYQWFEKTLTYLQTYYVQHELPFRPWRIGGNRRTDDPQTGTRIENYHHPRHLMFVLGTINRMFDQNRTDHDNTKRVN
ncbi:hypothetical protein HP439_05275 [Sphingobacterium shayense]|uniref:AGE family epimerase/isomerase n=1 Tax=Sphingobacterium shayense TaxID=626343 RepID=UPI001551DC95|nr:AGE family epimerase/isomerase [Sphingobacterium shayense]NQD70128.1 hypothetical protein [Sphingobacterium shayense]